VKSDEHSERLARIEVRLDNVVTKEQCLTKHGSATIKPTENCLVNWAGRNRRIIIPVGAITALTGLITAIGALL
jgi:hypothetical protein